MRQMLVSNIFKVKFIISQSSKSFFRYSINFENDPSHLKF